jgi:1,2-diacylglycerol 3-alpha-glucosyltransferase
MKVLITTDWYAPTINGVVTSILNLERELTAMGHDVKILTLSQTPRSYRQGNVTYIGAIGAGKIYPGARLRMAPARYLLTELARWHPDVIHSQCEFSTFLMARKLSEALDIPLVHTYHTVYEDYTHYFSPSRKWGKQAIAVFSRWVLSHTSAVIAPSEKVQDLLLRYRVDRPIHVIPTGIDLSRFSGENSISDRSALKKQLGISEEHFVLIYIGRLAKEKNLDLLLRCAASIHTEHVTLVLVGSGPCRAELEDLATQLGIRQRVVFAGMIPPEQVPDYYRLGDLFVSTSSSETQGLTYIEALASGLPALCLKDPCLSGVIKDGVNGWQFHDPEEFCGYLNRLMDSPALQKQMSRGAVISAQKYSAAAFARKISEVYEQLIQEFENRHAA